MPGKQQEAHKSAADLRKAKAKQSRKARLNARKYRVAQVMNLDVASMVANYTVKEVSMKVSGQSAADIAAADLRRDNNEMIAMEQVKDAERALAEQNAAAERAIGAANASSAIAESADAGLQEAMDSIQKKAQEMVNSGVDSVQAAADAQKAATAAGAAAVQADFAEAARLQRELRDRAASLSDAERAELERKLSEIADRTGAAAERIGAEFAAKIAELKELFSNIDNALGDLYKTWKDGIDLNALKEVMNKFLNDIMKKIIPCPGEKLYDIYYCNKHAVFCEKQLDADGLRTTKPFRGVKAMDYKTGAQIDVPEGWAGLCCERDKDVTWDKAFSPDGNFTHVQWPSSVCDKFLDVGLWFSGIPLDVLATKDAPGSQVTRQHDSGKEVFENKDFRQKLKDSGYMKLFFAHGPAKIKLRRDVMTGKWTYKVKNGNLVRYERYIPKLPDDYKYFEFSEKNFDCIKFEDDANIAYAKIDEECAAKCGQLTEAEQEDCFNRAAEVSETQIHFEENLKFAILHLILGIAKREAENRLDPKWCAENGFTTAAEKEALLKGSV